MPKLKFAQPVLQIFFRGSFGCLHDSYAPGMYVHVQNFVRFPGQFMYQEIVWDLSKCLVYVLIMFIPRVRYIL